MNCEIVPLRAEHLEEVVRTHCQSFPDFFLTFLGPRFLREYYASFVGDEDGIGFVALEQERHEVLGVVVGPLHPRGYYGRLLRRRWWAFCLASSSALCRDPRIAKRLLRALRYRGESLEGPERSLLSSLAVSPAAQGRGTGRALVARWLQEARRRGSTGAVLSTDADGNERVNAFYSDLGWQLHSQYTTPEGRTMNRFIHDLRDVAEHS